MFLASRDCWKVRVKSAHRVAYAVRLEEIGLFRISNVRDGNVGFCVLGLFDMSADPIDQSVKIHPFSAA